MRLSELSGTIIIPGIKGNSLLTIKTKIESELNALKARTDVIENVITFKTIGTIIASGTGESANVLLRIYKEGKIVIEKEGNILKIRWTVKLDTLYVLAFYTSIIAGITASLYGNTNLLASVIIGIAFFLIFILLGVLLIQYKLNDLIYASVYSNNP